ncbi:heterokaryon incompatibility protein-domain-containing protein [Phaeosphaeriaceae sp. PMI808]|nr:heterokaryon incompatibility protein-domain-containing protein [Phaeosphaeriaceae sp. PMI808]
MEHTAVSAASRRRASETFLDGERPDSPVPVVAGAILRNIAEEDVIGPASLLPFVPYVEKRLDSAKYDHSEAGGESFNPIEVVRKWLDVCEVVHAGHCVNGNRSEASPWSGPLLLIDCQNNCLVNAQPNARYVALSYTWGHDDASASTTVQNLVELQKPDGLNAFQLPRTIMDSIKFIRELGERYLWVDRLCVVQDGIAKQSQLNAMGNIYAGSYFTLVAATSTTASGPLYSERASPWPKRLKRPPSLIKYTAPKDMLSTQPPKLSGKIIVVSQAQHLMRSRWHSRAWTFQEYLFSKRRVVFQGDTVNWECLYDAWHEQQHVSEENIMKPPDSSAPLTGFKITLWPDMLRFARLVAVFNIRDLTFPEDALDAFAGVLSHLSRTFQGGFISGLPQMCFDAALLWQPWKGKMRRRRSVRCPESEAILPSWSWVGWTGSALNSESWRSAASYQYEPLEYEQWAPCSWRTISTVSWSYSISLASELKPIKITADQCIKDHENRPLPKGWYKSDRSQHFHERFPDQPFQSPVPIRDPHIAHTPPISARYLHGATKRAFLEAGETFTGSSSLCAVIDLLEPKSGTWAGVLRLNQTTEETVYSGYEQHIELIEISRGYVENKVAERRSFDEWMRGSWPRDKSIYEFYNVLWVEWKEGIAYRRAHGRVEKSAWERIEKDAINVTLG